MITHPLAAIILIIVVVDFLWTQYLVYRNRKQMNPCVPPQLNDIYQKDDYAKQQAYQRLNSRFGVYVSSFMFVILIALLIFGVFGILDEWLRIYVNNEIVLSLAFLAILYLADTIVSVPFDYYKTFVIEERFGFNKSTRMTFTLDRIKELLLVALIGGGILILIIWLYYSLAGYAWLCAWGAVIIFSLFMGLFYSNIIVPIFNKQSPLVAGELRTEILKLSRKSGFKIDNVYIMNASKRTTKANAYFTGFGMKKRIVLFDTLIKDLTTQEIVAILAHEIGHYKKKHTIQSMLISIIYSGVILFLLSLLLNSETIAIALGGKTTSFHLGLVAFSILFTPISMVMNILSNILSRRNEFAADAFAARFGLSEPLISGLKKLSTRSLNNLNPDSLYAFFHFSHPTLLARVEALKKK